MINKSSPLSSSRISPTFRGVLKNLGTAPLKTLQYTGPSIESAASHTLSTSFASPVSKTVILGMVLITAISSIDWCVIPAGVVMPGKNPIILTFLLGYAIDATS